jgi:hypothetical protein
MAKDSSKSRVRIFYADVEAGDESTERVLHSLATAFARAMQQPHQRQVVRALPVASGSGTKQPSGQGNLFDDAGQPEEELEEVDFIDEAPLEERTQKKPPMKRKQPTYAIVKDLNLQPEGKSSLRDFFVNKQPGDQQEQFAVILYYLCNIIEVPNIGANHIFTGFKDVARRSPLDILALARKVAHRKGWVDSSNSDNLRMPVRGQNFVEQDLPNKTRKASADAEE